MIKNKSSSYLLTDSDTKIISDSLACSQRTIQYIVSGERGKRQTEYQKAIIRALQYRSRQNQNLVKFCAEIKVPQVTPSSK